ncbi:TIGR00366 family protein [Caballeronia grimmiae]|uniref:TIGR00366 family protein n=1 Tax=Caballeronia grimmiae TaxID=1071679 RepID=UPI0038BB848A
MASGSLATRSRKRLVQLCAADCRKQRPSEGKAHRLISVTQTFFTGYNIFITVALIIAVPLLVRAVMPRADYLVSVDPKLLADAATDSKQSLQVRHGDC